MEKEEPNKKVLVTSNYEKKKISILLVENDDSNLQYTLVVLKKYYDMDFTLDGIESIEMAKKKDYDIILMDINLGKGIDGLQAIKEIRKIKGYEKTPIVAVTAFVRDGDKEEFLSKGCTYYLGKPFKKEELLDLINDIVQ